MAKLSQIMIGAAAVGTIALTGAGYYYTDTDTICTTIANTDTAYDNLLEGGSIARYVVNTADGQELDNTANALRGKSETDMENLQASFQAGSTYEIEITGSNILSATEIPTCETFTPSNS